MPKTNENTARAEPTQPQPDLPMRTAGNSDTADSEIDELEERRQELKSEYRALIRRQIDHWKGTPDDEAEIDRQFDLLEEKLDALGDDYEKFERSHDGGWKDIVDSIID
jgi:archaellum component FlaC